MFYNVRMCVKFILDQILDNLKINNVVMMLFLNFRDWFFFIFRNVIFYQKCFDEICWDWFFSCVVNIVLDLVVVLW